MLRALFSIIAFAALAFTASAEPRYALLIGNEDYPATVGPLSLPHRDVENMRNGLLQAGFPAEHIRVLTDAGQAEINLAVAELASDLKAAGAQAVGFFYYSGHGGSAESAGRRANYLIPAKSPITGAEQLPILGVPVNNIVDALAASDAKAVFIVSDACRNTLPFTSSKGGASDKGMVRVPRKRGLYIAFATADGATTPDDGLFAEALSKRLPQPGLSADRAFTLALREVAAARPGNAMPFTADGLTEDICFAGCDAAGASSEAADWARFSEVGAYYTYLRLYPDGPHAEEARSLMAAEAEKQSAREAQLVAAGIMRSMPPERAFTVAEEAFELGNFDEARKRYIEACDGGIAAGCTRLGILFEEGHGVDPDPVRARLLYQRSCDASDADACLRIGGLYRTGQGVREQHAKAKEYYAAACDLGDAGGCKMLDLYKEKDPDGSGVEKCDQGEAFFCSFLP
ncbi:caspase family protein [Hyphomonas sp.]|uniref:caspase family protein n=1 Tax=Hyphomonas sp. TaxID=87 RepID=UPI0035272D04